jgi:hypothetical protein
MSKNSSTKVLWWLRGLSFVLVAAGFLLPFWPLEVLGILVAGFSGLWMLAIILGLLLDLAYGAPVGRWHVVYFPFTLLALLCDAAYYYLKQFLIH